jgi:phosphoglycolate phosphatase
MTATLIFDFDGVIADSLPFVLTLANHYLTVWGKPTLELENFRKTDVEQLYSSYGVNRLQEIFLLWKIRREISRHLADIPLHSHIQPVISRVADKSPLYVLTSNSTGNVVNFLKVHRVHNYFRQVHGNFFLFNKDAGLRTIINRHRLNPGQTIYIGDEPRDLRSAERAGVIPLAVDWGYSCRQLLASYNPAAISSTATELLATIDKISAGF